MAVDLALRRKQWDEGEAGRQEATRALRHWQQDKDLAGIRGADALAKLPEAGRGKRQAFWADVDAVLDPKSSAPGLPADPFAHP